MAQRERCLPPSPRSKERLLGIPTQVGSPWLRGYEGNAGISGLGEYRVIKGIIGKAEGHPHIWDIP